MERRFVWPVVLVLLAMAVVLALTR
jgi:hypothetical protein